MKLEQSIQNPEEPETDPECPSGDGLRGKRHAYRGRPTCLVACQTPVLNGPERVPRYRQEDQNEADEEELVEQSRVEGSDDHRVLGLEVGAHSRHDVLLAGHDGTAGTVDA